MNLESRFWAKVSKSDGCWSWTASTGTHGYGQITCKGRPIHAHRVAYELCNGPIPKGAYVLHKCDNRVCVNPAHLFLGTHAENMADMKNKGRAGFMRRPGELSPTAKLSNKNADDVRAMCANGSTQRKTAAYFGISQRSVWNIVNGVTYAT